MVFVIRGVDEALWPTAWVKMKSVFTAGYRRPRESGVQNLPPCFRQGKALASTGSHRWGLAVPGFPLSRERRLAAVTRREFSLHFWSATKSVRQTETANNSTNSLLWLAVLRCYSASTVAEVPAFPRLRTIRWLLFLGINSDISGPPPSGGQARRCYVAAILSGATRGVGPLASRVLLISSIERPLVSIPRNAKTRPAWPYQKARNSRAGKIASSVTLGLT
jgi:hypothetical protein